MHCNLSQMKILLRLFCDGVDNMALNSAEIHIIDKCNYKCNNCSSFSNHTTMSGVDRWDDYADIYSRWHNNITNINHIRISGGEPLLNPDVNQWINGIANLWKFSVIEIVSNGSNIFNVDGLYEILNKFDGRVSLDIHTHSVVDRQLLVNKLKSGLFLSGGLTVELIEDFGGWHDVYNSIKDDGWDDCTTVHDFKKLPKHIRDECENDYHISDALYMARNTIVIISDSNNISLKISISDSFNETPLIYEGDTITLNDNDISSSFANCKLNTPYFYKGNIYKCKTMALLPVVVNERDVGRESVDLISSYTPLSLSNYDSCITKFKNDIMKQPIPQCKFCPNKDNASLNRKYT